MPNPLISIIVRTRDRLPLLAQALQSLVAQDYVPLEIIIINDGGTDVTATIQPFVHQWANLHIQQHPTSEGRAAAANHGLDIAQGTFVGFLDDDDLLDPGHISGLYTGLQQHPVHAAYAGVRVVRLDSQGQAQPITELCTPYDSLRLYAENFIPIHAVLLARELITAGCRFDTEFELFEDWDFWLQIAQHTSLHLVNNITATYRLQEQPSELHAPHNRVTSGIRIYNKWLSTWPPAKLYNLLAQMHHYKDEAIANLQRCNAAQLQAIGDQHSYALNIITEREQQLYTCNDSLQHLGAQHSYALTIVQERDAQLHALNTQHNLQTLQLADLQAHLNTINDAPFRYALKQLYKQLRRKVTNLS